MAIRDLFWACPLCGAEESLRPADRGEACRACGATFRRGRGAEIEAVPPGGAPIVRHAAEWVRRLPPVRLPDDGEGEGEETLYRRAPVEARFATGYAPVRRGHLFLGRVEQFGTARAGTLELTSHALAFAPESGAPCRWPLEEIGAVQPSSGVLQIRPRREPVVTFRFVEGSVRLWQELIEAALRRFYRRTGRGEIIEFQPRISTR
ncbi:MAG TPA: hypothetical protein VIL18_06660 [Longimicrobiales bacterium]